MKVVVAMDSFKGSVTSLEAGYVVAEGIHRADQGIEVCVKPLADGGEGTVQALTQGLGGVLYSVEVTGPEGGPYARLTELQRPDPCRMVSLPFWKWQRQQALLC